jgi:hypothetical protein
VEHQSGWAVHTNPRHFVCVGKRKEKTLTTKPATERGNLNFSEERVRKMRMMNDLVGCAFSAASVCEPEKGRGEATYETGE